MLDDYEQKLLEGWEEVSKKGQLTLWIMLALKDGPKHMNDIKKFIIRTTGGSVTADDKSMYRALRRYYDVEMVEFRAKPGKSGPDLKVYRLSEVGEKILDSFIKRNILDVFFTPQVKNLLERSK